MLVEEYCGKVRRALTGGRLKLEVEEELPGFLNDALDELRPHLRTPVTVTLPFSQCINVESNRVASILNVKRSRAPLGLSTFSENDVFSLAASVMQGTTGMDYSAMAIPLLTARIRNTHAPLRYRFDKASNKLYIAAMSMTTMTSVTITYVPEYRSVEEIIDPVWQQHLYLLFEAKVKLATGLIRRKAPVEQIATDGEALVSEATEALNAERSWLQENSGPPLIVKGG
jgi:hypothetical protein